MGKFEQGHNKVGGRKKGVLNERTLVLKSVTEALGLDVPSRLAAILPALTVDKQLLTTGTK